MDERPDTGGEWMNLVNKRLSRLERRLRTSAITPPVDQVALLVQTGTVGEGWEEVPELMPLAPSGWSYVRRARWDTEP